MRTNDPRRGEAPCNCCGRRTDLWHRYCDDCCDDFALGMEPDGCAPDAMKWPPAMGILVAICCGIAVLVVALALLGVI